MHPRERPTTRRQFLIRAGITVGALSGADAFLSACGGATQSVATTGTSTSGVLMGPGGIPLARRDHAVTLPLSGDNPATDSGKALESGPREIFKWDAYIKPGTVKSRPKEFNCQVNVTTF